jgi:monofunctional biosynthetic peptidoglycan transglycosylase
VARGNRRRSLVRAALGVTAVAFATVVYMYLTLPDVRGLAKTNPASTAFMDLRATEAARDGRTARHTQRWVAYSRISPSLKRAVLVAEDSAFWEHEGIDLDQIRASIQAGWEQGREIRGASTITQQLAKNLYLSPSRDPFRKLRELVITRRLEAALTKTRIFEIYLNVIEWGDGIWGVEAAARRYFGIPASAVNREQAALLAGAIINPRLLSPARPTARLVRRQRIILARMGQVSLPAAERKVDAVRPLDPAEAVESGTTPAAEEDALVEPEEPLDAAPALAPAAEPDSSVDPADSAPPL